MAVKYLYQGNEYDLWDENGKISVSKNASQKDLAYLHSKGVDGVVKADIPEVKAKK